jgi:hypothetical protein
VRKRQYAELLVDQEARAKDQRAAKLADRNAHATAMDAQHKALASGHRRREGERKARYAAAVLEAKAKRDQTYAQRYDALAVERAARDRAAQQYGAQAEAEASQGGSRFSRMSGGLFKGGRGAAKRASSADEAEFLEAKRAGLTCLNDHRLKRFHTPYPDFACSVCTQTFHEGTLMFGCRACDYDICKSCLAKFPAAASRAPMNFEQRKARAQSLDRASDSNRAKEPSPSPKAGGKAGANNNRGSASSSALNMSVVDGRGARAPNTSSKKYYQKPPSCPWLSS